MTSAEPVRCGWAMHTDIERDYHDTEWGVPLHDDRTLFEFLCLEGAQAGLSWRTILAKRSHYRAAFEQFDIAHCAKLTDARLERLLTDPGIVRNRLKVYSVRDNARAALAAIDEFGSLDAFLWSFVDGEPVVNAWKTMREAPTHTPASDRMSKTLKKRGFRFVGTTICYAMMQATGMVNDHVTDCFRYRQVAAGA
ncbi:MAG TPA: DNA-3-methyladenine glycosylase I [Dokdonella sp.]|uniref:DNA-3-methyladenine glycosylase I n=1 Tax=Dokdonella sp. TaxID=2291710 RepID=UPI002BBD7112|nr:DNA-3-methyladenine glycosylase I [Dokdonella sp.]HUD41333.1 DNA-3-methyladenine glycosylase I [Dokdonella sp.]